MGKFLIDMNCDPLFRYIDAEITKLKKSNLFHSSSDHAYYKATQWTMLVQRMRTANTQSAYHSRQYLAQEIREWANQRVAIKEFDVKVELRKTVLGLGDGWDNTLMTLGYTAPANVAPADTAEESGQNSAVLFR